MMMQLCGILLLSIAMTGCASQREADQPAAMPPVKDDGRTPIQVVTAFRAVLRGEMVSSALFMLDEVNYGSPAADQVRVRMKKMAEEMAGGGYDFQPVEQQVENDCAAVIIRENPNRNGPAQYASFFLMKRTEGWKISPEPMNYEKFLGLSNAQMTTFRVLDRWVQLRKADLKLESRKAQP